MNKLYVSLILLFLITSGIEAQTISKKDFQFHFNLFSLFTIDEIANDLKGLNIILYKKDLYVKFHQNKSPNCIIEMQNEHESKYVLFKSQKVTFTNVERNELNHMISIIEDFNEPEFILNEINKNAVRTYISNDDYKKMLILGYDDSEKRLYYVLAARFSK